MDCPRCGGTVVTYELAGATALDCEDCGYVGVPADHSPDPADEESWDEALRRYHERRDAERRTRRIELGDMAYRVPTALAEDVSDLTAKQQAVLRELLSERDPTDPDRTWHEIGDAADVHPSYAGEVARAHGDVMTALSAARENSE